MTHDDANQSPLANSTGDRRDGDCVEHFGTVFEYMAVPKPLQPTDEVEQLTDLLRPALDHVRKRLITAVCRIHWWRETFRGPDDHDLFFREKTLIADAWARDVVKAIEDFNSELSGIVGKHARNLEQLEQS